MNKIAENFIVRPSNLNDTQRIWEIRNHPVSRKYSSNPEIIPLENHIKWFKRKYFDHPAENFCFVLENSSGLIIGYCRFDYNCDYNNFLISVAVDSDYHGQDLGHMLLKSSLKKFKKRGKMIAEVQKDNKPSIKLFQKNNFKIFKEDKKNFVFCLN